MPDPVVHFEFGSKMPARLKEYYGQLFGWELLDHPGMNYTLAVTSEGGATTPAGGNINGGIFLIEEGPAYITV